MKYRSRPVGDAGYTLAEILVAITLFVVVSTIAGTLIVQANQATRKTTSSAFAQSQMLDVVSRVSREVLVSDPITYASPTSLETLTVREGQSVRTQFRYDAASGKVFSRESTAVAPAQAPTLPAMTDALTVLADPYKVVASNVAIGGPGLVLTYFNTDGDLMSAPMGAADELKTVGRVQIALTAGPIEGRAAKAQTLQTSMATRLSRPASGFAGAAVASATCPFVTVRQPQGSNDVTLDWDPISGATGYDITRPSSPWLLGETHNGQPGTTFNDPGLTSGNSYTYVVTPVMTDAPDCSASATVVNLVPGTPTLTGDVSGYYDAGLTWSAVTGATGYILQRDGATIGSYGSVPPVMPVVDADLAPSATYTYSVIATNATGNATSAPLVLDVVFKGASDTFEDTTGTPLDTTEVGNLSWLFPTDAAFTRTSGTAKTTTPIGSNPMAVVDPGTPDVAATIPTATGGEALYLRVQDGTNWLRARANVAATIINTYATQNQYAAVTKTAVSSGYTVYYPYYYTTDWVYGGATCLGPWTGGGSSANVYTGYSSLLGDYTGYYSISVNWCAGGTVAHNWKWWFSRPVLSGTGSYWQPTTTWIYPVTGHYFDYAPRNPYDYPDGVPATRQVVIGTDTTTAQQVVLEKSVNGTVSTLGTYPVTAFGTLKVVAKGDQLTTSMNGFPLVPAVTEPTFRTATQVGVGLGGPTYGTAATGIDNFIVDPAP